MLRLGKSERKEDMSQCCSKKSCCEDSSPIRKATTDYTLRDRIRNWLVRWNYGRSNHRVEPGLYALGEPSSADVVLVTANYKFSFDMLRRELSGRNAWILVLDTKGVNVWCAAGKGTFGTEELIRQIFATGLSKIVTSREIIVPQLGAPGVAAHEVLQTTGFRVVYGPVRAKDLPAFIDNGNTATAQMRQVTFSFRERLAVVPVEIIATKKYVASILLFFVVTDFLRGRLSFHLLFKQLLPIIGAIVSGTVLLPSLLPVLPGKAFSVKGGFIGLCWALIISRLQNSSVKETFGNVLLLPALSGFLGLNFTGCTTFTSQSGVNWEIKKFVRPMAFAGFVGAVLHLSVTSQTRR